MTQKHLRIRSEARSEINAAFEWYFQRSPIAADAFLAEIAVVLKRITAHPKLHPSFTQNTRRAVLDKFPYSVIFQEKNETILVIAVAHAKRRFNYWAQRF